MCMEPWCSGIILRLGRSGHEFNPRWFPFCQKNMVAFSIACGLSPYLVKMEKDFRKQEVYVSYVLFLNPCAGRMEQLSSFGLFPSPESARAFYEAEIVP